MSRRILIEGDSWAYIWDSLPDGSAEPRPGFSSMLSGVTCLCRAAAGSSNSQILSRIRDCPEPWDLGIVIVTEQLRNWMTVFSKERVWGTHRMALDMDLLAAQVGAAGSLDLVVLGSLRTFFQSLNDLGRPIWLLGGCSRVPTELLEGLDNLSCPIPSISTLLIPGIKDSIYQDTYQWASREYADWVIAQNDLALIKEWYRITSELRDKLDLWQHDTRYFFPDKWHPNQQAHAVLASRLDPLLQDFFSR